MENKKKAKKQFKSSKASSKKKTPSKYEWFTATIEPNSCKEKTDNQPFTVKVCVNMFDEDGMYYDTIVDAVYNKLNDTHTDKDYPDFEITEIRDSDGISVISDEDKKFREYLEENGFKYRVFPAARYVLTPGAILELEIEKHANVQIGFDKCNEIAAAFMDDMVRHGYITKADSDGDAD